MRGPCQWGERSGPRGQRLFRQESAAGAKGMHARDTASAGPPSLWNFLLSLSELVPREPVLSGLPPNSPQICSLTPWSPCPGPCCLPTGHCTKRRTRPDFWGKTFRRPHCINLTHLRIWRWPGSPALSSATFSMPVMANHGKFPKYAPISPTLCLFCLSAWEGRGHLP